MGKKRRGVSLDHLGLKALLQVQGEGVDVAKQLLKFGHTPLPVTPTDVPAPRHKYNVSAKEDRTVDGIVFDSKLEAAAYSFLKERKVRFKIKPRYVLMEGFEHKGKRIRNIEYEADFLLLGDPEYIVDLKGMKTDVFQIKKKLMLKLGHEVHEIRTLRKLSDFLFELGRLKKLGA